MTISVPTRSASTSSAEAGLPAFWEDRFGDDRPPGAVVGSVGGGGLRRAGSDAEARLSIDHGALRMRPLERPGWGREGVAYGPFRRAPGLAFAAFVLNGHNASQTYYGPEGRVERVRRWLGDLRRGRLRRPRHHENLAVGWFPEQAPRRPLAGGNGFVMHAATADNGELWLRSAGGTLRAVRGVQNLEIVYVVVLRDRGAAYYAASVPGAHGLGAHPHLRPLGLDVADATPELWAGVHQRILGEVGYRVDTRVAACRVAQVPELGAWYGTAAVADRLGGRGPLAGSAAEVGGVWEGHGDLTRGSRGARGAKGGGSAVIEGAGGPVGLVHARVRAATGAGGILFRATPGLGDGTWRVGVGGRRVTLARRRGGRWVEVAAARRRRSARRPCSLQVVDHGDFFGVAVDGELAFGRWFADPESAGAGAGVWGERGSTVADFEAHPREVPLPAALDVGAPWLPPPSAPVFEDRFARVAADLDGSPAPHGACWERSEGVGVVELDGRRARVRADRDRPNPGRTVYTVAWDHPELAGVEVEMVPPGTAPGQGHGGRGGVVLWQDPDNYLVVNVFLDDTFAGASISTFYHLGGREDMYDAVWTLVPGVEHGRPCRLGVTFDGARFLSTLDGVPSLYRALTDVYSDAPRLRIERVGLIVNWEWGDDTGTEFVRFTARGPVGPCTGT